MLLGVLFPLLLPALIESATLSMESFLGFNEHFLPGNWTPLTLTLENRGRDIEGTLELVVTSGSEYLQNISQSTYSADVKLPYNVKQLHAFSIKLNSFTHDLQIRFRQGDEALLERSLSLRAAMTEKPFVLVVDDNASPDFLSGFPPQVFPVNVRPKFLPEQSYAYESVRMVLLNIEMLPKLREKQFQALLKWIRQGGYLLLNGGMNVGAFSDPRANQLFPAQILGHREFRELPAMEAFCGQSFFSSKPFLLLRIQSRDAHVLLREADVPLLALRTLGKGQILFSALHAHISAFRSWEGKAFFWEKLFALYPPAEEVGRPELSATQIQEAMSANLPAALPNPRLLILFLVLYLPLLYSTFRQVRKHGAKQWKDAFAVTALLLAALFASFWLFSLNSKKALSYNTFAHLHGSGAFQLADVEYHTGLYTIQESVYRLLFDSNVFPIEHLPAISSGNTQARAYRIHQSANGQEVQGRSGAWEAQFFQIADTIDFPLNAEARLDEEGLDILFHNDSGKTIHNALLYFRQGLYALGSLQAGEELRHHIPMAKIEENLSFDPYGSLKKMNMPPPHASEEMPDQEYQITEFMREILRTFSFRPDAESYMPAMQKLLLPDILDAVHAHYQIQEDTVCFVGWWPETPIDMNIAQSNDKKDSLSLLTWEISVQKGLDTNGKRNF